MTELVLENLNSHTLSFVFDLLVTKGGGGAEERSVCKHTM